MKILAEIRLKIGMSQAEVGKKIGMSGSYVSHIENGRRFPQTGTLHKILAVLRECGASRADIKGIEKAFREKWEWGALKKGEGEENEKGQK